MKNFIKFLIVILFISVIILFTDCKQRNRTITGYLVAKEYVPKHMNTEPELIINYSVVMPVRAPITTPHVTAPARYSIPSKWFWYVANKNGVYRKKVNQNMFDTKCCGDTVTVSIDTKCCTDTLTAF